jgi:hypothetical protein
MGIAHALERLGLGKASLDDLPAFVGRFVPGGGHLLQITDLPTSPWASRLAAKMRAFGRCRRAALTSKRISSRGPVRLELDSRWGAVRQCVHTYRARTTNVAVRAFRDDR